jgi:hypothetical protein
MIRCQNLFFVFAGAVLLYLPQIANAQMRGGSSGNSFGGSSFGGNSFGGSSFGGSSFGGNSFGGSSFGGNSFGGSSFGGSSFGGNSFGGNSFGGSSFGGNSFGGSSFSGGSGFGSSNSNGLGNRLPGASSSNSDPFASTRASPISSGQYGNNNRNLQNLGNLSGGFQGGQLGGQYGNRAGGNIGNQMGNTGNSAANTAAQPGYVLRPGFNVSAPANAEVPVRVQKVLVASSSLPSAGSFALTMEGSVLVMKGQVASESEKRLAEAMLHLEPGVYEVRNELQVSAEAADHKK